MKRGGKLFFVLGFYAFGRRGGNRQWSVKKTLTETDMEGTAGVRPANYRNVMHSVMFHLLRALGIV